MNITDEEVLLPVGIKPAATLACKNEISSSLCIGAGQYIQINGK